MMHVLDIRGSDPTAHLHEDIVLGLRSPEKYLPSLLLWDDIGIELFDDICTDPAYYPAQQETNLLAANAVNIAKTIAAGSVIIELGSGNTAKTVTLLKALSNQKTPFLYFALDVSPANLQTNLVRLAKTLLHETVSTTRNNNNNIRGLCGTYDDLRAAMDNPLLRKLLLPPYANVTFLWLGNSIANAPVEESFGFLADLMAKAADRTVGRVDSPMMDSSDLGTDPKVQVQAIVTVDGCRDEGRVLKAYSPLHTPSQSAFLTHAFTHANRLLETTVFHPRDWEISTTFDTEAGLLMQDFVATADVEVSIDGEVIEFATGERVNVCRSGKWSPAQVEEAAVEAGLEVVGNWRTEEVDYGVYVFCAQGR